MLFENAFTAQAICAPSRSQLYTGNYPVKNGCFLNHIRVKNDQKGVSGYLREVGYEVILAGKSHVNPTTVFDWDRAWRPVDKGLARPYVPLDSIKQYFIGAEKPFCMFITSEYPHPPFIGADVGESEDYTFYPFIARWPGVIKAGSRSEVMIHYTDVLPTFIQVAGGGVPESIDGISFLHVLNGDDHEIHPYVYGVQSHQNILKTKVFPSRMVRSKKFKYIRNFNSMEVVEKNYGDNPYVNAFIKLGAESFPNTPFEELYDIVNDPYEENNLAGDPAFRETMESLVKVMYMWMHEQGDFLVKENYMPILKPVHNRLDQTTVHKTVPEELENTLTEKDYLILHY